MGLSRRMLILLDVIWGVVTLLSLVGALLPGSPFGMGIVVTSVIGCVAMGAGWILHRRTADRRWMILTYAGVLGATLNSSGGLGLLVVILVLALVVAAWGLWWGVAALGGIAAQGAIMMLALYKQPVGILVETISLAVLGGLGPLLGQILRELDRERRANQDLLAELRASHDVEKELMLAEERARSARELHDGLGHRLTLIGMSLEYAMRMRDKDSDKAFAEVEHAREQASGTLAYMRRWVRALNPPRDTDLTGIAAFEAISESFRGSGLKVEVHQTGEEHALGKEASLFAYRLVQEGLTNVLRHSNADEVDITVHWQGDGVEIELADNGRERGTEGLENTEAGFGLRSLTERAEQLGGRFVARVDERGVVLTGSVREGKHA